MIDFASGAVITLRLIFPLLILYFPLLGMSISFLLDCFDAPLIDIIKIIQKNKYSFWGDIADYYSIDVWLDLYYLTFALFFVLSWENLLIKNTLIFLFFIRLVGVIIFSLSKKRYFLFCFPNIFAPCFFYFLITIKYLPFLIPDKILKLIIPIVILAIPKLIIEYFFHVKKLKGMQVIKLFIPIKTEEKTIWGWVKTKF